MYQVIYSVCSSRKIVHMTNCTVIQRIDKKNRRYFESLDEARAHGYRLCSCCPSIAVKYRRVRKAIRGFCDDQGFSAFLDDGALQIVSALDFWRIITVGKNKKLLLYHRNTRADSSEETLVPGYHLQNCTRRSILEYLQYIKGHDEYRQVFPLGAEPRTSQQKAPGPEAWMLDKYGQFAPWYPDSGKPRKGTKRYKKEEQKRKKQARRAQVRRVYALIEQISCAQA